MKLSDKSCKAAKAKETPYKLFDGGGLFLEVMPNGSKLCPSGKLVFMPFQRNGLESVLSVANSLPLFFLLCARWVDPLYQEFLGAFASFTGIGKRNDRICPKGNTFMPQQKNLASAILLN